MLEVLTGDQDEFVIPDRLHAVAYHATHSGSVLDEIEFIFPMPVERVGEFRLVTFDDIEAVALRKTADF